MKQYIYLLALVLLACTCQSPDSGVPQPFDPWTDQDRAYLLNELVRSQEAILAASQDLADEQWIFRESPDRWSIAEVVEHLQLQDLMYWRELYVVTQFPDMHNYHGMKKADDAVFKEYSTVTDENTSEAPWYNLPHGRWATKQQALDIYSETRTEILDLVRNTDIDFRQHITPRGWGDAAELRDLHQLMLIMVAHTDRHLSQIERVKAHEDWPEGVGD